MGKHVYVQDIVFHCCFYSCFFSTLSLSCINIDMFSNDCLVYLVLLCNKENKHKLSFLITSKQVTLKEVIETEDMDAFTRLTDSVLHQIMTTPAAIEVSIRSSPF